MKDRLIGFIKTYCLFVCIFVLQKPLFMLFYKSLYPDASCADWFSVIWHGLPLDLSLAGYLTAIPGFLFITSVWTLSKSLHRIWCGYFLFISVLISIIFTVDLGLYEYWGFRLDATPLFYFFSSPKDAVASVSIWMVLGGIVAMLFMLSCCMLFFYGILLQKKLLLRMKLPYRRLKVSGILLLMTGFTVYSYPGGGFTVSTMNVGQSLFQCRAASEPCSYQPCIQSDGISCQAEGLQQAVPFYGSCGGRPAFLKTCLNPQVPVVKRKRQILCCNLPIHCILYSILSIPMYSL
mgnify:CR=1 FL=1